MIQIVDTKHIPSVFHNNNKGILFVKSTSRTYCKRRISQHLTRHNLQGVALIFHHFQRFLCVSSSIHLFRKCSRNRSLNTLIGRNLTTCSQPNYACSCWYGQLRRPKVVNLAYVKTTTKPLRLTLRLEHNPVSSTGSNQKDYYPCLPFRGMPVHRRATPHLPTQDFF